MDQEDRARITQEITQSFHMKHPPFAVWNATRIDARGVVPHSWIVCADGEIMATGTRDEDLRAAVRAYHVSRENIVDAREQLLVPGYVDIHAHGAWGASFDDGPEGIATARAGHMWHGTTRQVASLITNPLDVMCTNLEYVAQVASERPDILGAHLEGPFIAKSRKGAHDPQCLQSPTMLVVEELLTAAQGWLRQITIAPELPHALATIEAFAWHGVVSAVGHTSANYAIAQRAFDAGATLMTHVFNAMNGIEHREPGPIPAAVEDPRVGLELINDGFHIANPVVRLLYGMAPERTIFVTDAMAATDCPDGDYTLGSLDVHVQDGHARLVSNGAIAGSTLLLETAVQRAVLELGIKPEQAVASATLVPAQQFGLDQVNNVTGAPLGLIAPRYAADILLLDATTWSVQAVWCAGCKER